MRLSGSAGPRERCALRSLVSFVDAFRYSARLGGTDCNVFRVQPPSSQLESRALSPTLCFELLERR